MTVADGVHIGHRPSVKATGPSLLLKEGVHVDAPTQRAAGEPIKIRIRLVGLAPLINHNVRLADPDDDIVREIATFTSKRVKTEDDRRQISRLEWLGGLYTAPSIDGPAIPTANILKCLNETAKAIRKGRDVLRAVAFTSQHVPIQYKGPRDIDALFAIPDFHLKMAIGVKTNRTMRTRPRFPQWQIEANALLLRDLMDLDELRRIVDLAGRIEGLGDARVLGYGRFEAEVHVV